MWFFVVIITPVACLLLWTLNKLKLNPKDRYILITGCDTGFGNILAKSLDKKGCHVFATCLTSEGVDSLKQACSPRLHAMIMDVIDDESIQAAFDVVDKVLVDKPGLWGLVNNAGIFGAPGYYDWSAREDFMKVLNVNLLGTIQVTNVFTPLVRKAKGRIVIMSSGIALAPMSSGGYEMSKWALEAFSNCLRQQLRYCSVSVHIVRPAIFATPISNSDAICNKLDFLWNRMTEKKQEYYGRKCIDELQQTIKLNEKDYDSRLYLVIDAIEHALFAWYPRAIYPVGMLVWTIARVISIAPASIADRLTQLIAPLPKPQGHK